MSVLLLPYDLRYISDNGKKIQFGTNPGFILADFGNMTGIAVDVSLSQGFNQIGGTLQGESVRPKDIPIRGTIAGAVDDGMVNRRKMLLDAIVPQIGGRFVISFQNDEWELPVRPLATPDIQRNLFDARFHFTVRAPHPYWVNASGSRLNLSGLIARFKFPWFSGGVHMFGERIKAVSANARNDGNVPARFSVSFRAVTPVLNPSLVNVITKEFIKINRELAAGELVTVDMTVTPMTVTSSLSGNIFGNLDLESTPFPLLPGDNVLQDMADENPDGLECFINYRTAYTGPW